MSMNCASGISTRDEQLEKRWTQERYKLAAIKLKHAKNWLLISAASVWSLVKDVAAIAEVMADQKLRKLKDSRRN